MLLVEQVQTFYGRMLALRGVSAQFYENEAVCVIGPNGAGKSTLLHSICGIVPIRKGKILFKEMKIHRMHPVEIVRQGISLVPEGRRVFGPLTVKENLMMGGYVRKGPHAKYDTQRDLGHMFAVFPILENRQGQLAGELSGGEQQMLAIARALMSRPKLLMLDEPSMGLAPIIVREIFNVLERLKSEKTSILLVEQNARIALQLCDRGYILERGSVVTEGTCEELLGDAKIRKAYLGA